MKYIYTLKIFLILAVIFTFSGFNPITNNKPLNERYCKVKIHTSSGQDIRTLQENDVDVEHYKGNINTGIELEISYAELDHLKHTGIPFDILIADMDEFYANRPAPNANEMIKPNSIMQQDNINAFPYGSMGGFLTYAEVNEKLDSLKIRFPSIVSSKINIGTSQEGRTIWAVKVSDNVNVNESATEPAIYFDALHHAREPEAMASLMYYLYWLAENYGTNAEATYLVDNREIYFVPIANPDGYEYNHTTNPNGGGQWRKNRRNNGGSFGVDLNRNYPFGWGLNSGSSGTPSSDTYRGPSAGSEPETQAIMTFTQSIHPKIGFSMHSVAGRYLNPYSYNDTAIAYNIYSDFSSEFAPSNNYPYGTVIEMLDYYSSGTTRDFLHSNGTYCWTPEVGGSSFWPAQSEIIPVASENLFGLKYLTWVGGAFARFQNFKILGPGYVSKNDTLSLQIDVRNKGLSLTSKNVQVSLTTPYANALPLTAALNYDSIQARQTKANTTPFRFKITSSAATGDEMLFVCTVKQENIITAIDTFRVNVGKTSVLFFDDAENGTANWTKSGTGTQWDTSFVSFWSGTKTFADSRYGNSVNGTNNYFTLNPSLNLSGRVNPKVEFAAKWSAENTFDYIRLQLSTNNGTSWVNLPGKYTGTVSGQPSYTGNRYWVYEQASLTQYIGSTVRLRFNYVTDTGVPGDGFYFDNFRVVDYSDSSTSGITENGNQMPVEFSLKQNYPNPFNPATNIAFDIPSDEYVTLELFDVSGRSVQKLVNGSFKAGSYSVSWDASSFTSGVYFYTIKAGNYTATKKMLLLK